MIDSAFAMWNPRGVAGRCSGWPRTCLDADLLEDVSTGRLPSSFMDASTDVSLIRRLRNPLDRDAWNRFVDLYTPLVRRWAVRLQAAGPDIDELAQEVLTALVRAMPEFEYDAGRRFRGWMWTVTRNKWREMLRRRPSSTRTNLDLDVVATADPVEATDANEYHRYVVGRVLNFLREEFQPSTWQAFVETTMNDAPVPDVAERLGLTIGAVYAAKARVLRRLRQELEGLTEWN